MELESNEIIERHEKAHFSYRDPAIFLKCSLGCYKSLVNFQGYVIIDCDNVCQFSYGFYEEEIFKILTLPMLLTLLRAILDST